ncbi:unnamed protein product, partial [Sphacelaria rigidula]
TGAEPNAGLNKRERALKLGYATGDENVSESHGFTETGLYPVFPTIEV